MSVEPVVKLKTPKSDGYGGDFRAHDNDERPLRPVSVRGMLKASSGHPFGTLSYIGSQKSIRPNVAGSEGT